MWAKTSRLLMVGLIFLVGCGGSSGHKVEAPQQVVAPTHTPEEEATRRKSFEAKDQYREAVEIEEAKERSSPGYQQFRREEEKAKYEYPE